MILSDELSLLILSCDKYSDLWETQMAFLDNFWKGREIKTYILTDTNSNNYIFENAEILCAGPNTEFSDRLIYGLALIKSNYIFVSLDDYILIDQVNNRKILDLLSLMKSDKLSYLRLYLRPKPKRNMLSDKVKKTYYLDTSIIYSINLYPAIWTRDFLISTTIGPRRNPWQYEVSLHKYANSTNLRCVASLNNEFPILDAVRKGKFVRRAYAFLKRTGLYHGQRKRNSIHFEVKLSIKTFFARHTPLIIKKGIKSILRKKGYDFYSDYDNGT